jgi:hypothetical protein
MTQALFDTDRFDANLAALASRAPHVAARLRAAPFDDAVVIEPAKNGRLTMAVDGKSLLSKYAPERDIERLLNKDTETQQGRRVLVVLGFELGYLAEALIQRTDASIHVVETRPGVLRAALGARDLTALLSNERLFVWDAVGELFFHIPFGVRLEMNVAVRLLPGVADVYREHLQPLQRRIETLARDTHVLAFTNLKRQVEWFGNLVDNFQHYGRLPSVIQLRGALRGLPAVVVSAGPSLDKNAHLLPQWKGRGAIIAVGTALQKCQQLGFAPDLTVALEANDITGQFANAPLIAESYLALMVKCHPKLWNIPAKGTFFFGNHVSDTRRLFDILDCSDAILSFSGSVSTAAFSLAAWLGCSPIVLVGQDLAYGETGASHAGGIGQGGDFSVSSEKIDHAKSGAADADDLLVVEGYHGGSVVTKVNMHNYLLWFQQRIPDVTSRGVRVINATEGGARIHGAEQMPLAEVTETFLGEPTPITAALDACDRPEPLDLDRVTKELDRTKKKLFELIRRLDEGEALADRIGELLGHTAPPTDEINRQVHRLGRDEKRIFALAAPLNDLLTAVGGRDLLITETAFDYQGLSQTEALRMNMKQTVTMYGGIHRAAALVAGKLRDLEGYVTELR